MGETKLVHLHPDLRTCPACGKPHNGIVVRLTRDPPTDTFPCGCQVTYMRTNEVVWREGDGSR